MAYDHYRKALTCCGPHSADYMVTRMVRMGGFLKDGPAPGPEPLDGFAAADEARQQAEATALGQAASAAYDGWQASLPNDAGAVEPIAQPHNITRFDAATFTWRGGNNDVDNPTVRVERWVNGKWETYADQSGEVQTVLQLPTGVQSEVAYRGNAQQWQWTANFEAFDAYPRTFDRRGPGTPVGTYRFVVDGVHRTGGLNHRYHLVSEGFDVQPWRGIAVQDVRAEKDGSVSFAVPAIAYPRTYKSAIPMISDDKGTPICKRCTFRPWASTAQVATATVRVHRANGRVDVVTASFAAGRWVAATKLKAGDTAWVPVAGVHDSNGEINGTASPVVSR